MNYKVNKRNNNRIKWMLRFLWKYYNKYNIGIVEIYIIIVVSFSLMNNINIQHK